MDAKTAIGLDITRNHISGVLVNLLGEVLYSIRTRLHFEDNRKYYEELRSLVDRIIEEGRADPYTILGIGISMPGIIGADHKTITYAPVVEAISHIPMPLSTTQRPEALRSFGILLMRKTWCTCLSATASAAPF